MKKNHGFSLIELIVAIAVLAIVGSMITGFLLFGTRHYSKMSGEASLQEDSQVLLSQLNSYLIDANGAVCYYVNLQETGDGTAVLRDDRYTGASRDFKSKRLVIYKTEGTDTTAELIVWKDSTQELTYQRVSVLADGSLDSVLDDTQLLANNVGSFSVDLTELASSNKISFSLSLSDLDKSYETDSVVTLRNEVEVNQAAAGTTVSTVTPVVLSINVTPKGAAVAKGGSQRYRAVVKGDHDPSQEVIWSVTGNTSAATSIDANGVLRIADTETATSLEIIATSKEDSTKSGQAAAYVAAGQAYTLTVTPLESSHKPGESQAYTASIIDADGYSVRGAEISWAESLDSIGSGSFTTATGSTTTYNISSTVASDKVINLTATASLDGEDIATASMVINISTRLRAEEVPLIQAQTLNFNGDSMTYIGDNLFLPDGRYNINFNQLTGGSNGTITISNADGSRKDVITKHHDSSGVYKTSDVWFSENCVKSETVSTIDLKAGIQKMIDAAAASGNLKYINLLDEYKVLYRYLNNADYVLYAKTGEWFNGQQLDGNLEIMYTRKALNPLIVADKTIRVKGNALCNSENGDGVGAIIYSKNGDIIFENGMNEFTGILYAPNGTIRIGGGPIIINGYMLAGAADAQQLVSIHNPFTLKYSETAMKILEKLLEN